MKNKIVITILLIALFVSACGCGSSSDTTDSSTILFVIGDYRVTYGEAMIYVMGQKAYTEGNYSSQIWNVNVEGETFSSFLLGKIQSHIAKIYAGAEFAKSQGITLSSEEKTLINSAANYYFSGLTESTKDNFDIDLEMVQKVFTAYRMSVVGHDKLVEEAGIEVSQDEARVMVLAQIRIFTTGLTEEEVVVKNEKVNILKEKLAAGEDFVTLASSYNEAEKIQLTVTRDDLPDGEEKVAFGLGVNQISGVNENSEGFYIFKCLKANDQTLSDARRQQLLETAREEYYLNHIKSYLESEAPNWQEQVWSSVDFDSTGFSGKYDFYSVYDMFFPEI